MKSGKGKRILFVTISIFALLFLSIGVMAVLPSGNPNYRSTLDEVHANIFSKEKADNKANLSEIVAYINGEPIYMVQIIVAEEENKIAMTELSLSCKENSIEYALREELDNKPFEEKIVQFAKGQVVIQEAEKHGFTVSNQEIEETQSKILQDRKERVSSGDPSAIGVEKQYNDLFKKLGVAEKEYYENYHFLSQKGFLLNVKLFDKFEADYREIIKQTGEKRDKDAWMNYVQELFEKADFKIVR